VDKRDKMSKCPICGKPAYVGLFEVQCETKNCQNYRPAKPVVSTSGTDKVAITATKKMKKKVAIWDNSIGKYGGYKTPDGQYMEWDPACGKIAMDSNIRKIIAIGATHVVFKSEPEETLKQRHTRVWIPDGASREVGNEIPEWEE
jgi:hypothetical protein